MNWRRVLGAGVAGGLAYYTIMATLRAFGLAITILYFGAAPPPVTPLQRYILMPTVVTIVGALPLRLIGVDWRRSLFAALLAYVNAAFAYQVIRMFDGGGFLPSFFQNDQVVAMAFVIGAGATVLLATFGRKETKPLAPFVTTGLTLVLIIVVFQPGPVTFRPYTHMGLLACILLPAVAALMQYRPDEVEDEGTGMYRWDEGEVPAFARDQRVQREPQGPKP